MKILIAEDDSQIAESLIKNFMEENLIPDLVTDGEEALKKVKNFYYDIIILDWRMPKLSGIEVCRKIRDMNIITPIILLTALSDISNKVEALNSGADDYLTKPFSFQELFARILAINRRNERTRKVTFDNFTLDYINHKLLCNENEEIRLTDKEFELLHHFIINKGTILSKEEICESVWQLNFVPETNIVEAALKNLRKKLETSSNKKYIKNIYGEGYIFLCD